MLELTRVSMNPWDFTLYRASDGTHIMKVIFSEGEYKTDVERYFLLAEPIDSSYAVDWLSKLSAEIRSMYPNVGYSELAKSDLVIK